MRVVLANNWFAGFGGSETYLLTVAEQLIRLGHESTIHARELGEMAELARGRGVPVAPDAELPSSCDAVVTQDAVTAYDLAERYPDTPQLFVAHSTLFDLQTPPQLDGIVSAVVALSDRVEGRMRAMSRQTEVLRMRQPIDMRRFSPRGDIRATPKRALVLSNHLLGTRSEMLVGACSAVGIDCVRAGLHGNAESEPERLMADADVVIGAGRSVLEGMSCGRAAFVYDQRGGYGWVTPESYPELEADGFAGTGAGPILDARRLTGTLGAYHHEMGLLNRELAQEHHEAKRHTQDLVELLRRLAPHPEAGVTPGREMARLAQLSWRHEIAAATREREAWELRRRAEELEGENRQLRRRLDVIRASSRYRLGSLVARPLDVWRRLSGRGSYSQKP